MRGELTLQLRDRGRPFDPASIAEPDVNAPLDDRAIGGLGLFFMRKLMDEVRFASSPESGNLLTLIKRRPAPPVMAPRARPGWRDLFEMGERLLAATTFAQQRDEIVETAARVAPGAEISLWLDESIFRLPDWVETIFPPAPGRPLMVLARQNGQTIHRQEEDAAEIVIPLRQEETILGALSARRVGKFRARELDALEGVARTAAVALIAWHRITVERWRLGQLNLVRTVSAQIANAADLDELAHKVTRLIQTTFRYYYVAMFTLEPGAESLRFRASAGGATRRKGRPTAPVLEVAPGQGLIGAVAASGEEIIANDTRAEARFRAVDSLPETQSEAVFPLKIEERVVGVLDVQSDQPGAFHPYDLLVLRALADTIAVAVEGAHLYSALRRRADQLKLVAEVGKQISSILDLRELMQEVAVVIQKRFDYPYVHLFTVHPNRRQIHYEAGSGERSAALEGYTLSLDDPDGLVPWVARSGEMVFCNDVRQEPRYRPSPLPPANTLSEVTLPLIFNGQVYGVLDVQSDRLNAFGEDDKLLFEALSDAIAAAIHNADLYRSEQWRRQVADSLREVAVLLSANASLDQVLDAILTELERNLASDISAIWLLGDDDIYCAAAHGVKPGYLEQARRESPEAGTALARALLARAPLIRKPGEPIGPSGVAGGFGDTYASIAAPLRIGDQAVGVLTLAHHTPGRYGHEAQAMTTTFASYAAVSIENARLYDSAQEQAYASAALLQVAQAVVSLSDLDEILGTIVRVLPILVGVERAVIFTWKGDLNRFRVAQFYNLPDDFPARSFAPGEFPLLDAALARGQAVLCAQAHLGPLAWTTLSAGQAGEEETLLLGDERLLMAFPLMVKGEAFGVMLAEESLGGRRFRRRRLEILTGVAQQVALAIQNDLFQQETVARERLETEVQLARQIQQAFIPETLPQLPGWELAAAWRTARQVGGDFYDVFLLPNQRLGLFIADVADKGVPAALFMALTRTLIRAAVLETDSPAEALRRVNNLLYPDCQQGMFVTAVYGVIDRRAGTFTYANAGHNPPLYFSASGEIARLTRTGMALGVVESLEIDERSLPLAPGESLFLYTDGVTEAFAPDGQMFGEERLCAALQNVPNVEAMLTAVNEALSAFCGDLQPADDITMIGVMRNKEFPE
ncbi:MAG: hypothetical protein OHK0031_09330 [Anaerolineales bacterium]